MKCLKLFLICSISIFQAQTYQFDKMFFYSGDFNNVIYKPNASENYYLFLNFYKDFSKIIDLKSTKLHLLKTTTSIDSLNNQYHYDFSFIESKSFNKSKGSIWYPKMVTKLVFIEKIDERLDKYLVELYKNSNKKKAFLKIEIIASHSPINFFDIFSASHVHPFELHPNFMTEKPLIVHQANWESLNGRKSEIVLKEKTDVDFKIIIPN